MGAYEGSIVAMQVLYTKQLVKKHKTFQDG